MPLFRAVRLDAGPLLAAGPEGLAAPTQDEQDGYDDSGRDTQPPAR
ncbi:hypothetical protein ABT030_46885 [Streptomyces mirabilis]